MRHRVSFNLRTSLVLLSILCAAFALVVQFETRSQRAAIAIEQAGGIVAITQHGPGLTRSILGKRLPHSNDIVGPFDQLTSVILGQSEGSTGFRGVHIRDVTTLEALSSLGDLKSLNLSWTGISDEHFLTLEKLANLRELDLAGLQIGDGSVERCSTFSALNELDLSHTNVTDDVLEFLGRLPSLRVLRLRACTQISSKGLHKLVVSSNLEFVDVRNVDISTDEALTIRRSSPTCMIQFSNTRETSGEANKK